MEYMHSGLWMFLIVEAMRQLKFHEKNLLKKVDLLKWKMEADQEPRTHGR